MHISKKPLFLIPGTIALAIGLVMILAGKALKPINEKADFNRNILSVELVVESTMPNEGIIGLSGITGDNYYFQTKDPAVLKVTDSNLENLKTINLQIPRHQRMSSGVVTYVDSPHVTILAGRLSVAINTEINSDKYSVYRFPTSLFTRAVRIDENTFALRGVDTMVKRSDQIFVKANSKYNLITRENNVSETNKDAGISTDGMLNYDPLNNVLVYTHFYENKFICLDTTMNLKFIEHTIDNTRSFPINSTVNKNVLTATTPKRMINAFSTTYSGYLFNISVVKSNSDKSDDFEKNSSIDIYNLSSGTYIGTFYIPHHMKEKVRSFTVLPNRIIVFYKTNIISYTFSLEDIQKET